MDRIRLDMHMHTEYSRDSRVALGDFAELARKAQLGAVCITDHDTIEGGLRLREMDTGLQVIVGEEITTADGELVGLYLKDKVPPGLSADRSIDLIHEQGGLAYVPHPFSRNRRRHLRQSALENVAQKLDIVEVFNAREVASSSNVRALEFARAHDLPGGVGSDSHRPIEIGRAYVSATDEARALGIFGAPSFVARGEVFWGDDRLEDAVTWHQHGTLGAPRAP